MTLKAAKEKLTLTGLPDCLVARPLREYRPGSDGEEVEVLTRRRQRKVDRVELFPAASADPPSDLALPEPETRWLLQASKRRWSSIERRYGERAWSRSVELTRAGIVRLRCIVDERLALGEPEGWVLTDAWEKRRRQALEKRGSEREQMRERANVAATAVEERSPALAAALREAPPGGPTTQVLVFAAEDLIEGIRHDGPRAFSQAHFGHTKARGNAAQLLLDAGVPAEVILDLGLRRSARLGIAGAIRASTSHGEVAVDLLDGPVLLRTDQEQLTLTLTRRVPLVVVENLQAAEALADRMSPEISLVYTAGLPGTSTLTHIASLADQASPVIVIPDADLGGVRIGAAVLTAAPGAFLVDIGEFDHPASRKWPKDGASERGLRAAIAGPAGDLARACLHRGYPVEQELAVVEAAERTLRVLGSAPDF